LIERMMNSTSGPKRRKKDLKVRAKGGLALGYEVLEIRDEGDDRDEGDEGLFISLKSCTGKQA